MHTPLFKKDLLAKVLSGEKTQTRRTHKQEWTVGRTYAVRDRWFSKAQAYIVVLRKFRHRLGAISQEDVEKEGFKTREEFKAAWTTIYGSWDPSLVVTAYEVKLAEKKPTFVLSEKPGGLNREGSGAAAGIKHNYFRYSPIVLLAL